MSKQKQQKFDKMKAGQVFEHKKKRYRKVSNTHAVCIDTGEGLFGDELLDVLFLLLIFDDVLGDYDYEYTTLDEDVAEADAIADSELNELAETEKELADSYEVDNHVEDSSYDSGDSYSSDSGGGYDSGGFDD